MQTNTSVSPTPAWRVYDDEGGATLYDGVDSEELGERDLEQVLVIFVALVALLAFSLFAFIARARIAERARENSLGTLRPSHQ